MLFRSEEVRARLKLGTSLLQVQRSNHSVTVSPSNCLPQIAEQVRLESFNSTEGKYWLFSILPILLHKTRNESFNKRSRELLSPSFFFKEVGC